MKIEVQKYILFIQITYIKLKTVIHISVQVEFYFPWGKAWALPNTKKWDKIRPKWEVLVHKQGSKASAFGLCGARERAGPKDAHFPFYMQMLEWRSKWNDVKRERKYLISEAVSVKARVGSHRHTVEPNVKTRQIMAWDSKYSWNCACNDLTNFKFSARYDRKRKLSELVAETYL